MQGGKNCLRCNAVILTLVPGPLASWRQDVVSAAVISRSPRSLRLYGKRGGLARSWRAYPAPARFWWRALPALSQPKGPQRARPSRPMTPISGRPRGDHSWTHPRNAFIIW